MAVRIISSNPIHPWTGNSGWTTEVWQTESHEESNKVADQAVKDGWGIWLVANVNVPGLVVYRENLK